MWSQEYDDSSGYYFYINNETQEVTWEEPPEFKAGNKNDFMYEEKYDVSEISQVDQQDSYFDFDNENDEHPIGSGGSSLLSQSGITSESQHVLNSSSSILHTSSTMSAIPENMSTTLAGSSALSAFTNSTSSTTTTTNNKEKKSGSSQIGLKSVKGINPKGRRMGEFPTVWKLPTMKLANEASLNNSSRVIFGDERMTLIRINQWTSEKPQRYFLSTSDKPPEKGWAYCYSFFGLSHPAKDTHLFQVQHKSEPCLRSKIVRTLLVNRNRDLELKLIEDHKKVVGGLPPNNSLEFFARYEPQDGLLQINVQDMQAPDRHKITYKPPVGYWFQKYQMFTFACSLWNVQEYPEPHNFRIMPQGQSSTTDPGWEQCYAFWAFDKPYPGMIRCTVLQQVFQPGNYSGDFGDPKQHDPKSYIVKKNCLDDPGPIMLKLRQVNADQFIYQKFSQDDSHSGWDFLYDFYAWSMPIRGTTRMYVQVARNPTRYRLDLDRALPPWKDVFTFYAYLVNFGDEHLLNFPRVTSL
jgi:hypothetical protein